MVNVGIIGIGFMGVTHFKALGQVKGGRASAIASRDPHKRQGDWRSIQGNFGGSGGMQDLSRVACYETLEELLADPKVDLVDICLPTRLHTATAVQALEAGKHVLVEKPITLDLKEADRIIAAARRAGRQVMVAHVLRFFPEFLLLRQVIDRGEYGRVLSARFTRVIARPAWSGGGDAYRDETLMAELHIHDTDYIQYLFGMPRSVVSAGCLEAKGVVTHMDTLYDFGDAIRTGASTAAEDTADLDSMNIDLGLFRAYAEGYLSMAGAFLNRTEISHLAFSARFMTFIIGLRFLTDHLDGDRYFRTAFPGHNLQRARAQFRLLSQMEGQSAEMERIISSIDFLPNFAT